MLTHPLLSLLHETRLLSATPSVQRFAVGRHSFSDSSPLVISSAVVISVVHTHRNLEVLGKILGIFAGFLKIS